jgi:Xaa-Pro dipeptidase
MSGSMPAGLPDAPDAATLQLARRARLDMIRNLLGRSGLAVGLIGRPQLIRHLTGAVTTPGLLGIATNQCWLVAPQGSIGLEVAGALDIETIAVEGNDPDAFVDPVAAVAAGAAAEVGRRHRGSHIGAELAYVPAAVADGFGDRATDIGPLLDNERSIKDDAEIAGIRRAVAVVDHALAAAAGVARRGATERNLREAVADSIRADVGDDFELASNVASGERTTLDDPQASDRVLRDGDLVLLDLYPVVEGHVADLTRTWMVGEPAAIWTARHEALEAALEVGVAALSGRRTGAEVDRAVRDTLTGRVGPFAESMRHHVGHGVGIFAWERPWIGRRSSDRIGPRAVVCIEPGLYESGVGGMRLEGQFLVREDRVERLDRFPDDLLVVSG